MTPTLRRRLFVCLPVLLMGACSVYTDPHVAAVRRAAALQQQCDVRDYQSKAVIPERGEVRLSWTTNANLPPNTYEYTVCDTHKRNCHIQLAALHDYSNVCRLHDLAHGLLHSIGSGHE